MAQWVANGPCPDCGSRDGRGEYDDGSYWCFGCKRYTASSVASRIAAIRAEQDGVIEETIEGVTLPEDFDPHYIPLEAQAWMAQYELNAVDLKRNRVGWSHTRQRMIFPIIIADQLLAWQGRYFGDLPTKHGNKEDDKGPPKWLTRGKIHELTYILRCTGKQSRLVLVEDLPSAMKLQKLGQCSSPLFGAQITSKQKNGLLHSGFDELVFWLDRDKAKDAARMVKQFADIGFKTELIITDKDPKEIPTRQLEEILK